jgi:hypothetical protein
MVGEVECEFRPVDPNLQPNATQTNVEGDFWVSADPSSSLFDWKFPDPPHTMVFVSQPVPTGSDPITCVSHDIEDDAWQFLGGSMATNAKSSAAFIIQLTKTLS